MSEATGHSPKKKLLFMGSDPIALPALEFLKSQRQDLEICGIVTQPDRRSGRGMKLRANAIKNWAIEKEIPVLQPAKVDGEFCNTIREMMCDMVLVMAYGKILPQTFLDIPSLGTLNLHASILPKLRGASPIHSAIATGEKQSGVSLMEVVKKMDAGAVADQECVPILKSTTSLDLISKIAEACVPLLRRNLDLWRKGMLDFKPQNKDEVSYCRIITKADAQMDFRLTAEQLHQRIRAFQPWPGSIADYHGTPLKIIDADALDSTHDSQECGLIETDGKTFLNISCGEGALSVKTVQRPGAKALPIKEFLRGFEIQHHFVLPSYDLQSLTAKKHFKPNPF